MEYDLVRLFDHPMKLRRFFPPEIVVFGVAQDTGQCDIAVEWKYSASGAAVRIN
jgi:hypothetical protein